MLIRIPDDCKRVWDMSEIDGVIKNMNNDEFKRFDKIYWKLNFS